MTDWTRFSTQPSDDISEGALVSAPQQEEFQFEEDLSPTISNPLESLSEEPKFEELHKSEKETLFAGASELFLQEQQNEPAPEVQQTPQQVELERPVNVEDTYRESMETENFYKGGRWI